jgi:tryptophan synthase alpha chain
MNNLIDKAINKNDKLKIMTHIVAGYPDMETNINVVKAMALSGVDFIEIQIPFSDPMADGPTIMKANSGALRNKFTLEDYFILIARLKQETDIPLLTMSYANIPYTYGIEKFLKQISSSGIDGIILPDLPFDEENDNYLKLAKENNLHAIQVISPGMDEKRLKNILGEASGFVYTTLKVGITGAINEIDMKGLDFLKTIKKYTRLPVAAGFGISSKDHVNKLKGKAEIAIIGSYIIDVYEKEGLEGISRFIKECKDICIA